MIGLIDIHAHLLPGIDDGPGDWEDALATVRRAAEDGITHMVATSHMLPDGAYANERDDLLILVNELQERVAKEQVPITVHAGGEVYLTPETPQGVKEGKLLTYCDAGVYILVELPAAEIPSYTEQTLFELQVMGLTPIIAHPERNQGVMRETERLVELVRRGVLTQMTASSLRAKPYAPTAELLLQQGLIHFVASDTHGVTRRPPMLSVYYETLSKLVGDEGARRLLIENPRCVIEGEAVPVQPVLPVMAARKRRSLFGRLFGRH